MANPQHVKIARPGTAAIRNWRASNPNVRLDLSEADLRKANLSGVNLNGANLSKADLSKAGLSEADLRTADLREANLSEANLRNSDLVGTSFASTTLRDANMLDVNVDSTTNFESMGDLRRCFVGRYTMEYMSEHVSKAKRMDLKVRDDIARLRSQYSGIWMWFHLLSLLTFCAPYVWFVCLHWVSAHLQEKTHIEADFVALWEAVLRYVWNGGVGWREGWSLAVWSFGSFLLVLMYNMVRVVLLWKTKRLETVQEVSGLPVQFSLGIRFRFWNVMYQLTVYGYCVAIALVVFNTMHFLSIPVPVALPT